MAAELALHNLRRRPVDRAPSMNTGGVFDEWKKHSIYRIPSYMKDQNSTAYTPRMVSIGPYHNGATHLAAMEEHKARSIEQFLKRSNKPFGVYFQALNRVSDGLIEAYQQLDEKWKTKPPTAFLQLMVKDGAFLYEFLHGHSNGWDYHPQDPVFSFDAVFNICPYIVPDILMMENQIPLTVIERLMAVQAGQEDQKFYKEAQELVYNFLSCTKPFPSIPIGLHVLDVAKKVTMKDFQKSKEDHTPTGVVKSASELSDAGVRFRAIKSTEEKGISLENGTLNLPLLLKFDSSTEPLYLNGIAFEKLHPTAGREMNSFVAFMQGFISSAKDVRTLTELGVIKSSVGRDEDIADMIKKISKHVFFDPYSELSEVRDLLEKCYNKNMKNMRRRLRVWWRKLRQDYFGTPWALISFIAGLIILVLTFIQAVYAIMSYKHQ